MTWVRQARCNLPAPVRSGLGRWVGCGLGSGLLSVVLCHFRERGAPFVDLRSHSDNPSGANELYRKMGFAKLEN